MNTQEREVVQAALRKYRSQRARSFIKPKSEEEQKLIMEKVRSHMTDDSHKKRSESLKGHFVSEETKEKIRQKAIGRKHSEETKEKIRTVRSKQAITSNMLKALADNRGDKSLLWKGNDVGYRALHRWVENHLGKSDTCDDCGKSKLKGHNIHWANKSGEYKRELSDWIRLCAFCHKKYDKTQITR